MVGFTYGGSKSSDTDAIAAHDWCLGITVLIGVFHMHRLGVLGAELEDIAHLNTAGNTDGLFTAVRTDAALYNLGKVVESKFIFAR